MKKTQIALTLDNTQHKGRNAMGGWEGVGALIDTGKLKERPPLFEKAGKTPKIYVLAHIVTLAKWPEA